MVDSVNHETYNLNQNQIYNDYEFLKSSSSLKENTLLDYLKFPSLFSFDSSFLLPGYEPESKGSSQSIINIFQSFNKLDRNFITSETGVKIDKIPRKNDLLTTPTLYTFDMINKIIQNINIPPIIKEKIVKDSNVNKIEKKMDDDELYGKKRRRKKGKIKDDDTKELKKAGRKRRDDFSKRKHDKNSADNIIKKIKLKFFDYSLIFINNTLNSNLDKKKILEYYKIIKKDIRIDSTLDVEPINLIKIIDYKYIDKLKKETDLSLLETPLKDIFSNDISPKYSTLLRDSNKKIIERILEQQKDNANIMFAFNLTFGEWIDVFTYKKDLKSIKNYDEEKMKDLNNKFIKLDKLILEIYEKNRMNNYLSYFISYVFNYKRWFFIKKGRNRVSNKISQK